MRFTKMSESEGRRVLYSIPRRPRLTAEDVEWLLVERDSDRRIHLQAMRKWRRRQFHKPQDGIIVKGKSTLFATVLLKPVVKPVVEEVEIETAPVVVEEVQPEPVVIEVPKASLNPAIWSRLNNGTKVRQAWKLLVELGVVNNVLCSPSTVDGLKAELKRQLGNDWMTALAPKADRLNQLVN